MIFGQWSRVKADAEPASRRRKAIVSTTIAFLLLYAALSVPSLWRKESVFDIDAAPVLLALALATLSAFDLLFYRLPDALTFPLILAGLFLSTRSGIDALWWSAASAGIAFLLLAGIASAYHSLRGRAGLGLGDAKLLAASGAWLGVEALPSLLLIATETALVSIVIARHLGDRKSVV